MKLASLLTLALAASTNSIPDRGVSEPLARERAATISSLRYQLSFALPEKRTEAVRGSETVRFVLKAPHRVVLDFEQPRDHIVSVHVGESPINAAFAEGHLIVPAELTKAGENAISIAFVAGDEALNRNEDFLYTLFVPARARLAFPCFDQPDLKGRYSLEVVAPTDWQVVANGMQEQTSSLANGRTSTLFRQTLPIPTYLFAFAAGKFSVETAERNGRTFRMFHRETDTQKVARNRDVIFDLHAKALAWLEDYTTIKYPWGKFDFVLIPSFQFGGMEHPGAIFYNATGLMLDESATQNQLLGRASVIAHETSHMWFGDLVTMRWFNDVWMKEVLANFMAAKIVNPSFPDVNHDLRFLLEHYPSAYSVDRTEGSNPIRQSLANLDEAGTLYGAIIYDKAPVVMRQLEMILGEQGFRDGLREYLKRYSLGNATWLELVRILDARTPENLAAWSRVWVEQRGRPELSTDLRADSEGRILSLALTQRDPLHRAQGVPERIWPQRLQVTLGYEDHVSQIPVSVRSRVTIVTKASGLMRPSFVLPNGGGLGYGSFLLDMGTRRYLLEHLEDIPDGLARGSAWVDLWDNLLEAQIEPAAFLNLALRAVPRETDEQNVQLILGYLSRTFWFFLNQEARVARVPAIEALLRENLIRARTASQKAAWFAAFRSIVLTRDGLVWLERVWRREEKIEGLPLAEPDEIQMALQLAVREVPGWQAILDAQLNRTQNPDRKARLAFVMPSLSADIAAREQAFERFRDVSNRRREPWVLESLAYLHHPLREQQSEQFILPSLELLAEIQRTGDIFFPKRWMDATLETHRSPDAAQTVRDFLARHPELPERLRWIVLSSADDLFRSRH
jgi:aminopeptidase N